MFGLPQSFSPSDLSFPAHHMKAFPTAAFAAPIDFRDQTKTPDGGTTVLQIPKVCACQVVLQNLDLDTEAQFDLTDASGCPAPIIVPRASAIVVRGAFRGCASLTGGATPVNMTVFWQDSRG